MTCTYWFRFHLRSRWWTVYLVEGLQAHGVWGLCFYDTRRILVDARLSRRRREVTVLHEIMHAALAKTTRRARAHHWAVTPAAEEAWPVLRRLGARLPELPRRLRK